MITLGCRLNIAESESIRAMLGSRDTVVINSCAVTGEAVRQTRAAIRRARRRRPTSEIVVTGCAATIDPAAFTAMPEVSRIVANPVKALPAEWHADAPAPAVFAGHARALVEVQNGCDHSCTFCTIPAGRGPSRSVPAGAVVDRIAALVDQGHAEIVLTGVDLTSWGHDLPGRPTLGNLVARILRLVPALPRLRLSSLDSIEIDAELLALITGEPRVMPHVHLSFQAGDDLILKRMKRRHARADAVRIVQAIKARRADVAIGADLIAGFPTEGEAAFANTLALIDDCDIVHAHIFPYSPRPGTPAARMPQVDAAVVRERAARLRAAAAARHVRWLEAQLGQVQPVLVERPGTRGHTPHFAPVTLTQAAEPGTIVPMRIARVADAALVGERA